MYSKYISLLILLFSFFCFQNETKAEVIDRIVAEVNDEIITLSELNEEGKPFFQTIMTKAPANLIESEIQKARSEILDKIIEQLLIKQAAEKYSVSISENDIDLAIDSIISNNNVTANQFKEELIRMGTTEDRYRANLKNQMLRNRIINIEIRSKVVITDDKIKEYYDTYYAKEGTVNEGFHILQIGFSWGKDKKSGTPEEAQQLAAKVTKAIVNGDDFRTLAKTYSDLPSAEDGGDIGTFKKDEMATYMLDAISSMRPGETSEIIETPSGYQILKLLSAQQDGISITAPLDSVKNDIKELIYKQEIEKEYLTWMENLRDQAYIKKNI